MQHRCLRKYIFQKIVLFIFLANLQSPVNGGGRTVGRTVTKWNQPMRVHQRYRAFLTISMHMFGLAAVVLAPSVAGPLLSLRETFGLRKSRHSNHETKILTTVKRNSYAAERNERRKCFIKLCKRND